MIPFYLDHVPSGSSTRPFVHYAQLHLLDREFRKFDFGSPEKNIEHYGVSIPPKHDLSKVKVSKIRIFTLCNKAFTLWKFHLFFCTVWKLRLFTPTHSFW